MGTSYLAVIGDIVASRDVEDREQLQQRLRQSLRGVNDTFSGEIVSEFVLTTGDEFQGLLCRLEGLVRILRTLRVGLHPQEVRFGLGLGVLDTQLQPQAIGMDGPCFHRARDAIERAAARGTPLEMNVGSQQPALEIYSLLYGELRRGWTLKQREVVDLAAQGLEGVEIAHKLQISPSAVSQHLHAAGFPAISEATRVWHAHVQAMFRAQQSAGEGD